MAKLQRDECQIELHCDANKFFDVWACKPHQIPKICPNTVAKIELQEGEWNKVGSVQTWTYLIQESGSGKVTTFIDTTRVEELDVEKREIKYDDFKTGFINKNYNIFKIKMQVISKSDIHQQGCIIKWTFDYEKKTEDAPQPLNMYLSFASDIAKAIEAYCLNNA